MAAKATSQMMAWLGSWQPVPQHDDELHRNYGDHLMENMVEMRGFQGEAPYSDGLVGWEDSGSWQPSRWRRGALLVASLFLVTTVSVIWARKDSAPSITATVAGSGSSDPSFSSETFLPASTLATILRNPSSPQAQGLKWVEQHPQFKSMPLWRRRQLVGLATMLVSDCGAMPEGSEGMDECTWQGGLSHGKSAPFSVDMTCSDDGKVLTWKRPSCPQHQQLLTFQQNSKLPPEISLLTALQTLYLPNAYLSGSIPTELGELNALTYLGLGVNRLRGRIPSQLGRLTNLQFLVLNENQFSGSLPTQLGSLKALQLLAVSENQLTGPLPSQLQYATALTSMDLHMNKLSGVLPDLALLTHLSLLRLEQNRVGGPLPTNLGELTALTGILLPHNRFTGSIPTEMGLVTALQMGLLLGDNQLTGTVPTQLGQLIRLQELGLAENQLIGTIPTELHGLPNLQQFSIHDNEQVVGKVPSEVMAEWKNLNIFWIYNTSLTGTIPTEICRVPNLKVNCDRVSCPCASCQCI